MSITQDTDLTEEAVAPSQAVVKRIAALKDVNQTELAPLFNAVDPEALDRLVGTGMDSTSVLQIKFTYHGYDVTVTGDGVIHIDENGASER